MLSNIVTLILIFLGYHFLSEKLNKLKDGITYTKDTLHPMYSKGELMDIYYRIRDTHKKWVKATNYGDKQTEAQKKVEEEAMQKWSKLEKKYNYMIQANIDIVNGKMTLKEFIDTEDINIISMSN